MNNARTCRDTRLRVWQGSFLLNYTTKGRIIGFISMPGFVELIF